jgi:SAM-dependent methyltransferase
MDRREIKSTMDRSEVKHLIKNAYHSTDNFYTFADQINRYKPELVIDAGCGTNLWKAKIKNLVGFDKKPHPDLDYNCNYKEFDLQVQPGTADFVFCLGSMHAEADVSHELDLVYKWLKPGGRVIMRVRKDLDDKSIGAWTLEKIHSNTNKYNYTIEKPIEEKAIILNTLDDETFKWLKAKVDDEWEFQVVGKETHRREAIQRETERRVTNFDEDIIFKSWYVWWWRKQ